MRTRLPQYEEAPRAAEQTVSNMASTSVPVALLPVAKVNLNFCLLFCVFISFQAFSKIYMFKKLKRDESRKKDDAATGAGMSPPACSGPWSE